MMNIGLKHCRDNICDVQHRLQSMNDGRSHHDGISFEDVCALMDIDALHDFDGEGSFDMQIDFPSLELKTLAETEAKITDLTRTAFLREKLVHYLLEEVRP